jgi:Protein of unknown function (DUF2867)
MRVSPAEYLSLRPRAHELLHDVPLYDVSVVDLPGGGAGRSVADIRALELTAAPSRIANAVYGVRHVLGRAFGWDRVPMQPEESLLSHLSARDRRDSEITPGARDGPFLLLYQFPGEALSETRNGTVHLAHATVSDRDRAVSTLHPVSCHAASDSACLACRLRRCHLDAAIVLGRDWSGQPATRARPG